MKRYLICALILAALLPLSAQDAPGGGGAAAGGSGSSGAKSDAGGIPEEVSKEPESVIQRKISDVPLNQGVRFTFKDIPATCPNGLYLRLNKEKCILVTPMMGLAGARVPFPTTGMIEMYDKPIMNGEAQGNKIISTQLPRGLSTKVLGVIVPGKEEGQYSLFYIDEKQLEEGTIFIRNLTNERIGLQLDGDKVLDFPPGKSEIYAPSLSNEKASNIHPGKMYRQGPDGKWYVTRQLTLMCRPKVREICLIVWNNSINKPDFMKIQIAPENYAPKKSANKNGAAKQNGEAGENGSGGGGSAASGGGASANPGAAPTPGRSTHTRRERPPVGS